MNDDTRKLLKVFGVAVTDAEAKAERLAGTAAQLPTSASKEEIAKLLKDASELCRELNTRWLRSPSGSSPSRAACTNNWPRPGPGCKGRNELARWRPTAERRVALCGPAG